MIQLLDSLNPILWPIFFTAMDHHQSIIKNLCRVCGKKVKSYTHDKSTDMCKSLLYAAFGIEVTSEPDDVYPPSVCHSCYRTMQKIEKGRQSRVVFKTQLSISSWTPHTDTEPCQVCNGEDIQRHKKVKSTGRPCNRDITHLGRGK